MKTAEEQAAPFNHLFLSKPVDPPPFDLVKVIRHAQIDVLEHVQVEVGMFQGGEDICRDDLLRDLDQQLTRLRLK